MDKITGTPARTTRQTPATFLAPGQRYAEAGTAAWRVETQWTVVHVDLTAGAARVTYRCPNGHQIVMPSQQFEAAVFAGQLVPIAGSGRIPRC